MGKIAKAKYIIGLVSVLAVLSGFASGGRAYAQEPPVNDSIMYGIIDSKSPYYYPALMMRYKEGDTTLTLEDYRHLYYGYAWQSGYKPFETPPAKDQLMMMFGENMDIYAQDPAKILACCLEIMETEPFNPSTVNMMTYAYGQLGDTINERASARRLEMIVETIKSTGTGLKENSAWHVLYFPHATELMAFMDLQYKRPEIVSRTVEYIEILLPKERTKGYYFDYGRIYWFVPDKLPERTHPGWTINGIIPLGKRR